MKTYQQLINLVKKQVEKRLQGEASGHDFYHCQRVVRLALKIGKEEKANLKVLELAGWLHDIAVKKGRRNHEVRGAKFAQKFLKEQGVNSKLIQKVTSCIKNHRFSTGKTQSLEDKVLRDSDKIDVIGAIGIARIFAFAGKHKATFHDGKIQPNTKAYKKTGYSRTIIEHFYDKIFLLPSLLQTKTGKRIGQRRFTFTKQFVNEFLKEWEGKDI